ncbi:GNAT family N-acetyltransferase [Ahniella affigens]|uniref:GNAT family N-acetyltransferase n=1 Tax=Ahniella affigens TaxID=2021234 RepID=A0A2P1PMK0_9GAMM|nr:GNAT family N-acetyltransferase [Ahniella affigens]AVP96066.1 GNAT family N-acetyltransferase [Ahniella affigens]
MNAAVQVRRSALRDLPPLMAMISDHAAFEQSRIDVLDLQDRLALQLSCTKPRVLIWLAVDAQDQALGYMSATVDFSTWAGRDFLHMDCLFVVEDARGHGIGILLLQAAHAHAAEMGMMELQWQTPDWNHRARNFYLRAGANASGKWRFRLAVGS